MLLSTEMFYLFFPGEDFLDDALLLQFFYTILHQIFCLIVF